MSLDMRYFMLVMGMVAILAAGYGVLFWLSVALIGYAAFIYNVSVRHLQKPWACHYVDIPAPYDKDRSHEPNYAFECTEPKIAHFWLPPWKPLSQSDVEWRAAGLLTARELQMVLARFPHYQHPLAPSLTRDGKQN